MRIDFSDSRNRPKNQCPFSVCKLDDSLRRRVIPLIVHVVFRSRGRHILEKGIDRAAQEVDIRHCRLRGLQQNKKLGIPISKLWYSLRIKLERFTEGLIYLRLMVLLGFQPLDDLCYAAVGIFARFSDMHSLPPNLRKRGLQSSLRKSVSPFFHLHLCIPIIWENMRRSVRSNIFRESAARVACGLFDLPEKLHRRIAVYRREFHQRILLESNSVPLI